MMFVNNLLVPSVNFEMYFTVTRSFLMVTSLFCPSATFNGDLNPSARRQAAEISNWEF